MWETCLLTGKLDKSNSSKYTPSTKCTHKHGTKPFVALWFTKASTHIAIKTNFSWNKNDDLLKEN